MVTSREKKIGVLYALAASGFWGFLPIYFKALQHLQPLNILGHRVIWSVPFLALLITLSREWRTLRDALFAEKVMGTLFLSATLVATNWFIFILAVTTGRILQSSLGYFISPLVNVFLGIVFLRERLRPWQVLAVLLAAAGTLNLTLNHGEVPWIALALAFTFGFYGLLRKTVRIESVNGLFVETSLLSPFAFGFLVFRAVKGAGAFGVINWQTTTLLIFAGAVTSLPLVWFTSAARRLRYSTAGLLQYISPTIHFLLAVFYYGELFTLAHLVTFGCIWAGLAIFMTVFLLSSESIRDSTMYPS